MAVELNLEKLRRDCRLIMADPHAAATLQGQAAAIPIASIAGTALGIPLDLLGWAMFGGLVAEAYAEPRQPPLPHPATVAKVALHLAIAAGLGGALAPIAADVAAALAAKFGGFEIPRTGALTRACAIGIGMSTAFFPEAIRVVRARLAKTGGTQ